MALGRPGLQGTMILSGFLVKPWGSAAGGVPVSASAAMATTNANLCGSGHACAPWRIVAWSPDGVISAFTRVLQEPAAVKRAKARNAQTLSALPESGHAPMLAAQFAGPRPSRAAIMFRAMQRRERHASDVWVRRARETAVGAHH